MAIFASDNFNASSDTLLDAWTPSGGGSWTKHANSAYATSNAIADGTSKTCHQNANVYSSCYYHSATPASATYSVGCKFDRKSHTSGTYGIAGRISTSANTMYLAVYSRVGEKWQLTKIVAGTSTVLGEYAQVLTVGVQYNLVLDMTDSAKRVLIDGVERITSADNTITAAGKAGVRFEGNTATPTTGYHVDDWYVSQLTGAVGIFGMGGPLIRAVGDVGGLVPLIRGCD